MERQALEKCTVLVTRPTGRGEPLCKAIQALGGQAIHYPTLEILPTENPGLAEGQFSILPEMDMVIFISPTAVEMAKPFWQKHFSVWPKPPEGPRVLAIGEGTAKALEKAGIGVDKLPTETYSSRALLKLPEFQTINFQSAMIVKGEGGNPLLEKTLSSHGVQVMSVNVYRRGLPQTNPSELVRLWKSGKIDCVISASCEGLVNLSQLLAGRYQQLWKNTPLLVISENMVKVARELGYTGELLRAANATNKAVIAELQRWRQKQTPKEKQYGAHLEEAL